MAHIHIHICIHGFAQAKGRIDYENSFRILFVKAGKKVRARAY